MKILVVYLPSVAVLFAAGFLIFRVLARRDYRERGHLSLPCSLLELALWLGYVAVPHIYNPPCWPYVWSCESSAPRSVAIVSYLLVITGAVLGFGSMAWLGVPRSFGRKVTSVIRSGPYRITRNPQVLGGFMMVSGIALLWPSWYALGWVALWMAMFHTMVLTEEEHLRRLDGEEYERYCQEVPRYIGFPSRR